MSGSRYRDNLNRKSTKTLVSTTEYSWNDTVLDDLPTPAAHNFARLMQAKDFGRIASKDAHNMTIPFSLSPRTVHKSGIFSNVGLEESKGLCFS
jgi:hypothetical protein